VNVNAYYRRVATFKKNNLKQNKLPVQEIVPLSAVQEYPDVSSTVELSRNVQSENTKNLG